MEYSVRKLDATDFEGARFRVTWWQSEDVHMVATVPYDYGAADPWLAAAVKATGKPAEAFDETGPTGGKNRWYRRKA